MTKSGRLWYFYRDLELEKVKNMGTDDKEEKADGALFMTDPVARDPGHRLQAWGERTAEGALDVLDPT